MARNTIDRGGFGDTNVGSDYSADETEWLRAVDRLKRSGARFPTNVQLFRLFLSLGYRKAEGVPNGPDGSQLG